MHEGRIIFSQTFDFIPRREFDECVARYNGNYKARSFSCRDQFVAMAFAQLTGRESLRDIEACLRAMDKKLYHAGLRGNVSKSTLGDANKNRDYRIYEDFARVLISRARKLYADDEFGVELENSAYAIDATTIDLCLSLFPWARFRANKGGVKLHTLMELKGNIPCVIRVSEAKEHDVAFLDEIDYEPGSFYIMDKAYVDFARLYWIDTCNAFFVTRAKANMDYTATASRVVDETTGLIYDQTIVLNGRRSSRNYPDALRRITFCDPDTEKYFFFLTNNFTLDALTIARLYKLRWRIELFFKWIKQRLRIKSFFGNTLNAVKTQIWIAISVYVLVAIIRKELKLERSLYEILQVLSVSLFEQVPMPQVLKKYDFSPEKDEKLKCPSLFDL